MVGPDPEREPETEPEQPRLSIGLRMAFYYLLVMTILYLGIGTLLLVSVPAETLAAGQGVDFELLLLIQVLLAPLIFVATRAYVHRVDRKPMAAIGVWWPGRRNSDLRGGVAAALCAAGVLFGWLLLVLPLGSVRLETAGPVPTGVPETPLGGGGGSTFILFSLALLVVAALEEVVFRGYLFTTLRERLPWIHASGVTALLFVLLHSGDSRIAAGGLLNIFLLAFILGALREISGSIWPGVVFHGIWNITLGLVLGLPVSGEELPGWQDLQLVGPAHVTGGEYGPEGSWLMALPLAVALLALARRLEPAAPAAVPPTD